MLNIDLVGIIIIVVIGAIFFGLFKIVRSWKGGKDELFDFERDRKIAMYKPTYKKPKNLGDITYLGTSPNKQEVVIENDAKHVLLCGTTGAGKSVALANFIKSVNDYDYPALIVDGKGDTNTDSLLDITQKLCPNRKIYIVNLNDPLHSDKYNPFKNTSPDIIKDMLINMTNWSEEYYKYNTERYIQRLCKMLVMMKMTISLDSLVKYLPTDNFIKLSKDLSVQGLISKEEHIEDIEIAKTSGKIAEQAAARFATIKESNLGQIFDEKGIDIYTALAENAIILFILNPLSYPEMSPLIGNLIIIDSKKAVSNFYSHKKERIFYLFDEINVYANASFLDLVNKSRSANITCVLATQSLADLDKVNEQFKEQVIENCNNYLILRQNSPVNADYWSNVIGTREAMQVTYQIKNDGDGASSTDRGSYRKTHEFIFHPSKIKELKQGEAFFLSRDKHFHTIVIIHKPF